MSLPDLLLTGLHRTPHFAIHYRPGSRSGAAVDRTAFLAERDFEHLTRLLKVKPDGPFDLYLYDDLSEMTAVTRNEGTAGFASGRCFHVPCDSDPVRFHEMVHVVAALLPRAGDEPRSMFFAEGLADALLEFVDGVHVHALAAFEKRSGRLPPLIEMVRAPDFYAWMHAHPAVPAYHLAASYFRFLIDALGITRVKRYYRGMPARKALGRDEDRLEKDWHDCLDAFDLRREVETLLRRRRGEPVAFAALETDPDRRLPPEVLGRPEDWKSLAGAALSGGKKSGWQRRGEAFSGTGPSPTDWSVCRLGRKNYGACAMRALIRPAPGCVGVQFRLGTRCQAMITNAGTFVWQDRVEASDPAERINGRSAIDFFVERRAGRVTIWIDGLRVVEGQAGEERAPVTLGVSGGSALFEGVRVRDLEKKPPRAERRS